MQNISSDFAASNNLKYLRKSDFCSTFIVLKLELNSNMYNNAAAGAHTIGISQCSSFSNRLYNFTGKGDMDPSFNKHYAAKLKLKCKPEYKNKTVEMDPSSFRTFDTYYYTNLMKHKGLFQSDAALLTNNKVQAFVNIESQGSSFFSDFIVSMEKMGRIGVLTGTAGQIQRKCALTN